MSTDYEIQQVIDNAGHVRRLGTLIAPPGLKSSFPVYEASQKMLTATEIEDVARSGKISGKSRFPEDDWIRDQKSHGSCFPPGTFIRMADGTHKPIEQVKVFDKVVTAEGNVGQVSTLWGKTHEGQLHKIVLWGNNMVRCTPEHPILTRRGYVAASELTSDDWVCIPKYASTGKASITTADYMPMGRKYAVGRQFRSNSIGDRGSVDIAVVPIPDVIELTPEVGYIFGLFLAEGNTDSGKVVWTFNLNEEDTLAAELGRNLKACWGVDHHIQYRGGHNTVKVVIYGTRWAKLFEALFATGSGKKRVPPEVMSGSVDFKKELLRGWLDGDGHARRNEIQGVSISRSLAMSMYDIGNELGRHPSIRHYPAFLTHHVATRQDRYEVTFYNDGSETKRMVPEEKQVWRKLRRVEIEDYSGPVYNLEVPGDNSYVADGLGVHNCNGFASAMALSRARVLRGLARVLLSGAYSYSRMNGGRDNGSILEDGMKNMQQYGICPESLVGWDQIYRNQYDAAKADAEAARYKGFECFAAGTKEGWYSGLAMGYVGVCAVHVGNDFMRMSGEQIAGVDNGPGNHAVLAEGLSWRGQVVEDGVNSWGLTYGDRGRMGLVWAHHAQTFGYHMHYLIKAGIDDPQGEEPPVIKL